MNWKLTAIANWPERAQAAKWSVGTLARHCGVSVPILERHFAVVMHQCPHAWLVTDRLARAPALLTRGYNVGEVAGQLCYGSQHHFSRAFKQHYSYPPSEHRKRMS